LIVHGFVGFLGRSQVFSSGFLQVKSHGSISHVKAISNDANVIIIIIIYGNISPYAGTQV
jgi:hypothetical protein